jgi:hypothetical protein
MRTDELERDLKALAEPQADDEHLHRAIRALLGEELRGRSKTRRRSRRMLGVAVVAAAALVAAAAALVGTGGLAPSSADAAILAHVARVIEPPADIIVHVREIGVQGDGTQVSAEWWQETNAPYAIRLIKGAVGPHVDAKGNTGGGQVESAADGTTSSQYDADTNTIYQRPDSTSPRLIDPIESVRAALAQGTAQVAGTVTIAGQSLYEIGLPDGVVGYFDRSDYRPVYLDNPQRDGSVVRTTVITYEELSVTPANELLLRIGAQHPKASVETGPPPGSSR